MLNALEHWLMGCTWLHVETFLPGHPVDFRTHGTVFCCRCGERRHDWRDMA